MKPSCTSCGWAIGWTRLIRLADSGKELLCNTCTILAALTTPEGDVQCGTR